MVCNAKIGWCFCYSRVRVAASSYSLAFLFLPFSATIWNLLESGWKFTLGWWAIGQLLQLDTYLGSLVKNLLDSIVDENLKDQGKNGVYGVCVRSQ